MNIEKKWDLIDKHIQYIHRNLDVCCQDLCEGQQSKYKLEEVTKLLVDIKEKYEGMVK
jgi:hypothetical protein